MVNMYKSKEVCQLRVNEADVDLENFDEQAWGKVYADIEFDIE